MTDGTPPARPASYDKGRLGSAGRRRAGQLSGGRLRGAGVLGISARLGGGNSIGAINAAIIAGNAPEHRVQRLRSFWDEITAATVLWPPAPAGPLAAWQHRASALTALMFGQPGFLRRVHRKTGFQPTKASATTRPLRSRGRSSG